MIVCLCVVVRCVSFVACVGCLCLVLCGGCCVLVVVCVALCSVVSYSLLVVCCLLLVVDC